MKQNILIIGIILLSIVGGFIGCFIFNTIKPIGASSKIIYDNQSSIQNLESKVIQTVQDISPSVVSIIIKKDILIYRSDPWGFFHRPIGSTLQKVGGGSGFFIRKDGIILTNKHVVSDRNAEYTVVLSNGVEYNSEVIAYVKDTDLALIRIQEPSGEFQTLQIQDEKEKVYIGSFAIAIGNALAEFQNSVSLGIISGKNREIEAQGDLLTGLLQTDAAINPGNSGGPLINLNKKVVGVNTAIASGADGVGFAIEIDNTMIQGLLDEL